MKIFVYIVNKTCSRKICSNLNLSIILHTYIGIYSSYSFPRIPFPQMLPRIPFPRITFFRINISSDHISPNSRFTKFRFLPNPISPNDYFLKSYFFLIYDSPNYSKMIYNKYNKLLNIIIILSIIIYTTQ